MGLLALPSRTDDSLGRFKEDLKPAPDFRTYLRAEEYNRLADAVIEVCRAVGLADGTTPESLVREAQRAADELLALSDRLSALEDAPFFSAVVEGPLEAGDAVTTVQGRLVETVKRADPVLPSDALAVGCAVRVEGDRALIQVSGTVRIYVGLLSGRVYYLGRDGRPTLEPPAPEPGEEVCEQVLGRAASPTAFVLSPFQVPFVRRG